MLAVTLFASPPLSLQLQSLARHITRTLKGGEKVHTAKRSPSIGILVALVRMVKLWTRTAAGNCENEQVAVEKLTTN